MPDNNETRTALLFSKPKHERTPYEKQLAKVAARESSIPLGIAAARRSPDLSEKAPEAAPPGS
ncbi:hypothetical protein FACS1894208_12850 [Clostridia bacterium]|nr:hypothetical protein FACS1894208_12850 [Clostridia bacterium]